MSVQAAVLGLVSVVGFVLVAYTVFLATQIEESVSDLHNLFLEDKLRHIDRYLKCAFEDGLNGVVRWPITEAVVVTLNCIIQQFNQSQQCEIWKNRKTLCLCLELLKQLYNYHKIKYPDEWDLYFVDPNKTNTETVLLYCKKSPLFFELQKFVNSVAREKK